LRELKNRRRIVRDRPAVGGGYEGHFRLRELTRRDRHQGGVSSGPVGGPSTNGGRISGVK